jgi:hypothetical protein
VTARPIGPYSLYWACRIQGADAYRVGKPIDACPYGVTREFSGRAWRDRWRAAAQAAGVKLPYEIAGHLTRDRVRSGHGPWLNPRALSAF